MEVLHEDELLQRGGLRTKLGEGHLRLHLLWGMRGEDGSASPIDKQYGHYYWLTYQGDGARRQQPLELQTVTLLRIVQQALDTMRRGPPSYQAPTDKTIYKAIRSLPYSEEGHEGGNSLATSSVSCVVDQMKG